MRANFPMPVALSECFQAANGTAHHLCKAKDWNVVLRVGSHLDIPLGNAFTTCSGYERDGLIYHASDGDIKVVRGKVSTFDKEQGSPMGTSGNGVKDVLRPRNYDPGEKVQNSKRCRRWTTVRPIYQFRTYLTFLLSSRAGNFHLIEPATTYASQR
jgi:hypothetical protein